MNQSATHPAASSLARLFEQYAANQAAARAFRVRGGKVVGLLSNHIPQELVLAAGMFPVLLWPDFAADTPVGDKYMEPFFDGPIRSMFDRLLTGQFAFADLVLIPRTSEGYLQLFYYLNEARVWEPEASIPEVALFDLLHTPFWLTGRYVRGRMNDLRERLQDLAGRAITDADVSAAMALVNEQHRLLAKINSFRRAATPFLSGVEALQVFATAWTMDRREHCALLRDILDDLPSRVPLQGVRLMVKGSPHDSTRFYELVEGCGAVVVADDHLLGERMVAEPTPEGCNPMEALTGKYHLRVPSIRSYPQAAQDEIFVTLVVEASVQAVVFYHEEHDDTLGWDYPGQKRALDALGIPSIFLKQQSYRKPDVAAQRAAVKTLLAQVAPPA